MFPGERRLVGESCGDNRGASSGKVVCGDISRLRARPGRGGIQARYSTICQIEFVGDLDPLQIVEIALDRPARSVGEPHLQQFAQSPTHRWLHEQEKKSRLVRAGCGIEVSLALPVLPDGPALRWLMEHLELPLNAFQAA